MPPELAEARLPGHRNEKDVALVGIAYRVVAVGADVLGQPDGHVRQQVVDLVHLHLRQRPQPFHFLEVHVNGERDRHLVPFRRLGATHVVELVDGRHADEFSAHVQSHLFHRAGDPGPVLGLQTVGIDRTVVQVAPVVVLPHEHEPPRLRMAFRLGRRPYLLVREGPLLDGLLSTLGEYDAAGLHSFAPLRTRLPRDRGGARAVTARILPDASRGFHAFSTACSPANSNTDPGVHAETVMVRKSCLAPNRSFPPPTPPFPLSIRHSRESGNPGGAGWGV